MSGTQVDIIVPVYNVEAYLRRCLNSIISQTHVYWRAICVDDGSTDGCPEILDAYAEMDDRFVVVHKDNGGLSDARNVGMEYCESEYVMFVDSDDLIHPQTLEIALSLAQRHGSDIVSWYRDAMYTNWQLKLLRYLGKDTINARPWRIDHRYDLDQVASLTVDDLLPYCSDWNHPAQTVAVKHCWAWRHLIRRSALDGVSFVKGLKFEDISWWSELILKPLRATITQLPLYYYYTNNDSISNSTSCLLRNMYVLRSLDHAYQKYLESGDGYRMSLWSHNIKWAILCGSIRELIKSMNDADTVGLVPLVASLAAEGFFDDAVTSKELLAQKGFLSIGRLNEQFV